MASLMQRILGPGRGPRRGAQPLSLDRRGPARQPVPDHTSSSDKSLPGPAVSESRTLIATPA